jgi:hypothetical protein
VDARGCERIDVDDVLRGKFFSVNLGDGESMFGVSKAGRFGVEVVMGAERAPPLVVGVSRYVVVRSASGANIDGGRRRPCSADDGVVSSETLDLLLEA